MDRADVLPQLRADDQRRATNACCKTGVAVAEVVRDTDTVDVSDTDLHASRLCKDDAPFAIGAFMPGCRREYAPAPTDDGRWCVWFLDPTFRSWARFDHQPETRRWPVHQFGPRRLYDEVATAYQCWNPADRPGHPVAVHITPDGQPGELAGITRHESTHRRRRC